MSPSRSCGPTARTTRPTTTPRSGISANTAPPGGGEFEFAAKLSGHTAGVLAVAFSPDGQLLATGSMDRTVRLWDLGRRLQRAVLTGHGNLVSDVAFSPDGRRDQSTATRHVQPRASTRSVTFSADGELLATCGTFEHAVPLWEVAGGIRHTTLTSDELIGGINDVAFAPDGSALAWADTLGNVKLWERGRRLLRAGRAHVAPYPPGERGRAPEVACDQGWMQYQ